MEAEEPFVSCIATTEREGYDVDEDNAALMKLLAALAAWREADA